MKIREFTIIPIRRPAGKVKIQFDPKDKDDIFKDRAVWLLEALGAYYSHRAGYCLSPKRAEIFEKLYRGGWDVSRKIAAWDKKKYEFWLEDGPKMNLKEVLRLTSLNMYEKGKTN